MDRAESASATFSRLYTSSFINNMDGSSGKSRQSGGRFVKVHEFGLMEGMGGRGRVGCGFNPPAYTCPYTIIGNLVEKAAEKYWKANQVPKKRFVTGRGLCVCLLSAIKLASGIPDR